MVSPLPGTKISSLPPAISLIGDEEVPCVQAGTTKYFTLSQLPEIFPGSGTILYVTTAGTVTVPVNVSVIIINKSVPSSTPLSLPSVSARHGLALHVTDFAGTGGDIIATPAGSETIMSYPTLTVGSGGVPGSGGSFTITPNVTISGWYL